MKVSQFRLIGDIYYVCIGLMAFTEGPIGPSELLPQAKEACDREVFVTQAEYVHQLHVPADDWQQCADSSRIVRDMTGRFDRRTGDVSSLLTAQTRTQEQVDSDYGLSEAEEEFGHVLDNEDV